MRSSTTNEKRRVYIRSRHWRFNSAWAGLCLRSAFLRICLFLCRAIALALRSSNLAGFFTCLVSKYIRLSQSIADTRRANHSSSKNIRISPSRRVSNTIVRAPFNFASAKLVGCFESHLGSLRSLRAAQQTSLRKSSLAVHKLFSMCASSDWRFDELVQAHNQGFFLRAATSVSSLVRWKDTSSSSGNDIATLYMW
jgi:hypothetical protein